LSLEDRNNQIMNYHQLDHQDNQATPSPSTYHDMVVKLKQDYLGDLMHQNEGQKELNPTIFEEDEFNLYYFYNC